TRSLRPFPTRRSSDLGQPRRTVQVAEGLWIKCDSCKEIIYRAEVERAGKVCPKCRYPFRISAGERIATLVDAGSFEEHHANLTRSEEHTSELQSRGHL